MTDPMPDSEDNSNDPCVLEAWGFNPFGTPAFGCVVHGRIVNQETGQITYILPDRCKPRLMKRFSILLNLPTEELREVVDEHIEKSRNKVKSETDLFREIVAAEDKKKKPP